MDEGKGTWKREEKKKKMRRVSHDDRYVLIMSSNQVTPNHLSLAGIV